MAVRSLDTIMEDVIGKGTYQKAIIILVLLIGIPASFMQTASVFIAALPEYRCNVKGLDSLIKYSNVSKEQANKLFIPWNDVTKSFDKCHQYNYNLSSCENNDCIFDVLNSTAEPVVVPCTDKYHFNQDVFVDTIVTEWNLVCDRLSLKSVSTSVFYLGVLFGSVVGGVCSDIFGRVFVFKIGCAMGLICGFAIAFAPNYHAFCALRFLLPFFFKPASLAAVVYALEICRERWRTWSAFGYNIVYGLGCLIMGGIAMCWRSWRPLEIALSVAFLPLILIAFFLPKSPRWLVSKGKLDEAKETLLLMAKRNKTIVNREDVDNVQLISSSDEKSSTNENSLKETFCRPFSRMVTVCNMFVWMITSMVYYGISLNSGALAGNIYLNHSLGGLMEFLACIFSVFVISRIGCRYWTVITLVTASLSCLLSTGAIYFWPESSVAENVGVVLAMIGRFGSSAAFGVLYMHTVEMFPTSGRNTALGLASMAARLGSIISPFTLQVQYELPWLTQAIFGLTALLAAMVASNFPETKDTDLLMTFDETEAFFKKNLGSSLLAKCFCLFTKRKREELDTTPLEHITVKTV